MYANTGVPISAVIAPTGSSAGDSTVLATRSANSISIAPMTMDAGIIRRWSLPSAMRHACGTTRPTNPMIPQNATQSDVSTDATIIVILLNLFTLSPSWAAWSSPMEYRLNSLAHTIAITDIPTTGMNTIQAFSHVTLAKDP